MTTFNFHIGLPRVGADILHSVARSSLLKSSVDRHVVAPSHHREVFRGLINRGRTKGGSDTEAHKKAKFFLHSLSAYQSVAFSQHALLGTRDEIISSPMVMLRAAARVARLSDLFGKKDLSLHLTVTNQVEYLLSAMGPRAEGVLRSTEVPSWSALVTKLRAAAADRPIVVWDFEQPNEVALSFVVSMLNLNHEAIIDGARTLVKQTLAAQSSNNDLIGLHDLTVEMDARYDNDLAAIERIAGVSLIRGDNVPREMHI
jgi:hypothetical protein